MKATESFVVIRKGDGGFVWYGPHDPAEVEAHYAWLANDNEARVVSLGAMFDAGARFGGVAEKPANVETGIADFVDALNARHGNENSSYAADPGGRRYRRIVRTSYGSRASYAFVDLGTGDILKAESWTRPAKDARGSVLDPASYATTDPYGSWLYK